VYGIAKNLTTELVYCMALCGCCAKVKEIRFTGSSEKKRVVDFGFKVTALESRLEFVLLTNGKH
jgi:hypothetical protein